MNNVRTTLLVASVALLAGALGAPAQQDGAPQAPVLPLPDGTIPEAPADEQGDAGLSRDPTALPEGMLPALPEEREAARQAQLDALFEQLAAEDNPHWQVTQNQIMTQWRQSGSASMDLLLRRGIEKMEGGDYNAALDFFDDLVRLAPDFAEGWNQRATVYFLQGRYGYSVADIRRVLALEPRHFGAISGLGIILDRLGDDAGALEAFRRVIELHPNMPGAQEGISRLSPDVDGRPL